MKEYRIKTILSKQPLNRRLTINGWVRTRRDGKGFSFLEINDGSCLANLQVIADEELANYATEVKKLSTGCSVRVCGDLVASPARGQEVELRAATLTVLGWADPATYPLQKKRHSFEFLRTIPHLRPRTNALAAVTRIRNALNFAIHRFFNQRGFCQIHTPIITTSDCEGAGEMFTVTTLTPPQGGVTDPESWFAGDFFGRRAGLTVSGQLQAEIYALALGRVYTFGPTFRAENSNTSRHLAEFWMVEPEMAFCDLSGNMEIAASCVKETLGYAMDSCTEDLQLLNRFVDKGLLARLQTIIDSDFYHISYTEAIRKLNGGGADFTYPVKWGLDLQAEHERWLTEVAAGGRPVIVTDYPREIKPFYMRINDDEKTVAAMDILVPGIGELIGGSQREERFAVLTERMDKAGLDMEEYGWYLDLRRYGSVVHSGFGLGFERLVQLATGMRNIREVIPFPRTPGSAAC